jgi:hypothetical protein
MDDFLSRGESMRLMGRCSLIVALLLQMHGTVFAWHDTGHMIVAQIAYLNLTPTAKAKVDSLFIIPLGKRPLIHLCSGSYSSETCERTYDPIQIAVWMDDIRGDSLNDSYATWHYVDIPFFDGVPERASAGPEPENALMRISWAMNSLRRGTTGKDKTDAELVGFLFHLIGDVHQPLHASARVTAAHPDGDQGGNLFNVRMPSDTHITNLHAFWDAAGGVFGFTSPRRPLDAAGRERILTLARGVMKEYPLDKLPESKDLDPHTWIMESSKLAREIAYKNITEGDSPSNGYVGTAQNLSKKRLALAGYRLAGVLNMLFANALR